jgi:hypothetical protein
MEEVKTEAKLWATAGAAALRVSPPHELGCALICCNLNCNQPPRRRVNPKPLCSMKRNAKSLRFLKKNTSTLIQQYEYNTKVVDLQHKWILCDYLMML